MWRALSQPVLTVLPPLYEPPSTEKCIGDAADWMFCYRWLLLDFKREFQIDDVMQLWEVHYLAYYYYYYYYYYLYYYSVECNLLRSQIAVIVSNCRVRRLTLPLVFEAQDSHFHVSLSM
jgi:hypothetical protein